MMSNDKVEYYEGVPIKKIAAHKVRKEERTFPPVKGTVFNEGRKKITIKDNSEKLIIKDKINE